MPTERENGADMAPIRRASPTEMTLLMDEVDAAGPTLVSAAGSPTVTKHDSSTSGTIEAHNSLQNAKDRAQITASTSMSIVHVVLLKQLLVDFGPDTTTHLQYYVSLSLVIAALVIQVLAGFIALYIAFIRKYVRRYKADAGDYRVTICPWRCKKRSKSRDGDSSDIEAWINGNVTVDGHLSSPDDSKDCCSCCPWQCQNQHFIYNGFNILKVHSYLQAQLVQADTQLAACTASLKYAQIDVQKARDELKNYTVSEAGTDSSAHDDEHIKRLENDLRQALSKLAAVEQQNREITVRQAKYRTLQKHTDAVQSEILLKQAESWQNVLNLMLYTVFILNAFIAGFGMGTTFVKPKDGDTSGNSTSTSTST